MNNVFDRRAFLKTTGAVGLGLAFAGPLSAAAPKATPNAAQLGWRLACAAYSFNRLTFYETIDKVAALGLDGIEAFTWQGLSPEKPKVQTNETMPPDARKEAQKRLADKGVKLVGCYCAQLAKEDACRRVFEWAKEMGMEYLVAEPPAEIYDVLEKLCDEYRVSLAVHNHPQPSKYWSPDVLLGLAKGRGPRVGACCDTGHWVRSGLDPVEQLKKLQGRIVSFHLKDIESAGGGEAKCVPFGKGKGHVEAVLKEAHRQGFRGVFAVEYEPYSPQNFGRIAECAAYFDQAAAKLLETKG